MVFRERLKKLRADRRLTQEQLANMLNIPSSTIRRYESADDKNMPKNDRLQIIADFFGCSIDYLLGRTNNPLKEFSEQSRRVYDDVFEAELTDEDLLKKYNFTHEGQKVDEALMKKILDMIRVLKG